MSYYHYLAVEILLLTMAIANFKDSHESIERLEKIGIQYIDCGTSGGVYGLGVDIVLWLVVQVVQYLSVPPFSRTCPGLSAAPADPVSHITSAGVWLVTLWWSR